MARKPTDLRPIMTRLPERLRARLEREAARNDRSMNSEINYRLERSLALDEARADANKILAEAKAAREAQFIQAIRQAGMQIVREHGKSANVMVSAEMLLAEASGILRSGFVAAENINKSPLEILVENAVERALRKVVPSAVEPSKEDKQQ